MSKTVVENYTAEQVQLMKTAYTAVPKDSDHEAERAAVVDRFAAEFGKHRRSIIGKLVRENVYIAKVVKGKDGTPAERKEKIVDDIADLVGYDRALMGSLENSTKGVLKAIREALQDQATDTDDDS